MERHILEFWDESLAFRRLINLNSGGEPWSFMDGPKTANNPIGVHHAWGRTLKDLFQRYRAMLGHRLRYQNGFDCQGLWVEVEVERELGFSSKLDIEEYGVDEFVRACKRRVLRYASRIVNQSRRLGQWMDWDDTGLLGELEEALGLPQDRVTVQGPLGPVSGTPDKLVGMLGTGSMGGSYFTLSDRNNYSIWGFLKACHLRGWVYKGADVVPWCPRCSTALSEHELETEGYREISHRSPTVKFRLRDRPEFLLVWTTTPWTIPSNVAIAVNPEMAYVKVWLNGETIYLAEDLVCSCLPPGYRVLDRLSGSELVGLAYEGVYDDLDAVVKSGAREHHEVVPWDQVSPEEGTGLVHIAPGCGKEDFELASQLGLPSVAPLDDFGVFVEGFGSLTGLCTDESSRMVLADLESRGMILRSEDHIHRYPVCWRCETPVVFRLVDEWFIAMDRAPTGGGPTLRESLVESAKQVRWLPSFGLQRELDWLNNMGDWMISKKRYWGLSLPIWECDRCGCFEIIGDREELRRRATGGWEDFDGHSPHRPWVDMVTIECPDCGAGAHRIPDVGNPWLDAGIVPFSTLGYFQDREEWERWFPVEFVCESLRGQFRNWFYALLVMSTVLEGGTSFKVCLGHGDVRDADGREMHSSLGNAIWFDEAVEELGADMMRWMYCSTSTARDLRFSTKLVDRARRDLFMPLWNICRFFVAYAEIDRWSPGNCDPELSEMDRWVLSRLNGTISAVTEGLEDYDPQRCTVSIQGFISDLSRWYLRNSRRRFWKNDTNADKDAAYFTLYRCLEVLASLMAPFTPFLSEHLYQSLVRSVKSGAPVSVHHNRWPSIDESRLDGGLEKAMELARKVGELGRSIRAGEGVKLRQPLGSAVVVGRKELISRLEPLKEVIEGELNISRLLLSPEKKPGYIYEGDGDMAVGIDLEINEELMLDGLSREIVRHIQNLRKLADLEVDERILVHYRGGPLIERVFSERLEYISRETLSTKLIRSEKAPGNPKRIGGEDLVISISPVGRKTTC